VDLDIVGQLLIEYSVFVRYWRKMGQYISCLYILRWAVTQSKVLYNIVIEIYAPMKLVNLIKMCLNENYNKVHIAKNLYDAFPIQNHLKQGSALLPMLFNFA